MKHTLSRMLLCSVVMLSGCAGMNSEFEFDKPAKDTGIWMSQADDMTLGNNSGAAAGRSISGTNHVDLDGYRLIDTGHIAADMVMTYINGLLDVAETAASGTLNTEDENTRFRENLMSVRSQLGQRVSRIQVQQNGVMELEQNLSYMRQQLSSGLSDKVMSNYEFGGQ